MITRHQRAGIDGRWHKKVRGVDGTVRKERSAVYGRVTRWRVRWVDDGGTEYVKVFERRPDAQVYLDGLSAEIQRGEYADPRKSTEAFAMVGEEWFSTKQHRQPKPVAGSQAGEGMCASRIVHAHELVGAVLKYAVRYVDALIWSPTHIGAEVAAGVRRHFIDEHAVELTLDVMRNAMNKIAVALGGDAPRVAHGAERYLIGDDGQSVFS